MLNVGERFFVPLFSFVGSILLHHIRHFILLRRFKRRIAPHGNRIAVELITAIWRGSS
jgi:hypothetical protein